MLENKYLSNRKQNILIFLCWLAYMTAYLGRYSYNANIKVISEFFGVGKDATGLVTTCFFFVYGAGQIINGLLCKKYNKRILLTVSLIVSAVINAVIGFGVDFEVYKYLWLLNGVAQSVLWSSLILVLGENLDEQHLKKGILAMATTVPIATFIIYGISALFTAFLSFKATFFFASICLVVVALIWFFGYSKNTIKIERISVTEQSQQVQNKKLSPSLIATICIICAFAIVCNLVKDGLQTWTPVVLGEKHKLPDSLSILLTLLLPLVGVFGSSIAIFVQSKLKNYVLVLGIFFGVVGVFLIVVITLMEVSWIPVIVFMALAFCISQATNNVITSIAPLQLRDSVNPGLLTGIFNGCCYVGSTISGYGLGSLVEGFGDWGVVFWLMIGLCAVSVIVACVNFILLLIKKRKQTTAEVATDTENR